MTRTSPGWVQSDGNGVETSDWIASSFSSEGRDFVTSTVFMSCSCWFASRMSLTTSIGVREMLSLGVFQGPVGVVTVNVEEFMGTMFSSSTWDTDVLPDEMGASFEATFLVGTIEGQWVSTIEGTVDACILVGNCGTVFGGIPNDGEIIE